MVKHLRIILLVLLAASVTYAASTNFYWDYPETTELAPTDRLLVYKGQSTASRDRNILGSRIAQLQRQATFTDMTANQIYFTQTPAVTPGENKKIILWGSGLSSSAYGIGVSSGAVDYVVPQGGLYNWLRYNGSSYDYLMRTYGDGMLGVINGIYTPSIIGFADNLDLYSNSAHTGYIKLGTTSAYDEPLSRLGIGTQAPTSALHVNGLPVYGGTTMANANTTAKAASLTKGAMFIYSTAGSRVVGSVW